MKTIDTILQIRLGDEFFGIDSDDTNQILRVPIITSIPLADKSLSGIVVLNGKIVPVLDIKTILGIGTVNTSEESSRIITLNIKDDEVAILVDEVVDALNIDSSNYEENISQDSACIGFYKNNEDLIQVIEPKNIIQKGMIETFCPIAVEKLSDESISDKDLDTDTHRYLFFKAKDELFTVDLELVAELIFVPEEITPIAGGELSNLGVITLRDEVINVFDFNLLFGFEAVDSKNDNSRLLILRDDDKKLALCVEGVEEIKDVDISKMEGINNSLSDDKIESLYKDDAIVVSVVSAMYLKSMIDEYSVAQTDDTIEEEKKDGSDNMRELTVFAIGNEEFAFDIESVQEIITYQEVTPLPDSNEYIDGVINLRGSIIPVLNLPKKLNFQTEITEKSKIVVCSIEDEKVGFLVDDVNDIMFIEDKFVAVSKNPDALVNATISLNNGKRVILELRLDKIISVEELQNIKED
jgi:purine-binding chemotaxis protein CheW